MARLVAIVLALLSVGCGDPNAAFDDYLARTQVDGGGSEQVVQSQLEDLSGRWLVHALLAGGLELGLRMEITMDLSKKPIPLHAKWWLATSDPATTPPLVETDTTVAADGTFALTADPLVLEPGALPLMSEVRASVTLNASTLSPDAWCGTASGSVTKPLMLDLSGSTFAARRDDGKTAIADVPEACFPKGANHDAGTGDPPEPPAPDLSSVSSQLADISGSWILEADLAGSLPLQLWAELVFVPGSGGDMGTSGDMGAGVGGSLDGALRRATDPPGSVALATFSTTVDEDGRFAVWLPHLTVGKTEAAVLLVGATRDANDLCGAGAGHVYQPISLDLAGTTFGGVRWTPGTPLPSMPPNKCQ